MCASIFPLRDPQRMELAELAAMAKDLRALSHLDGTDEFDSYSDPQGVERGLLSSREEWLEAVTRPPRTTTQVNVCIIKASTRDAGCCYAEMLEREHETATLVGEATHFVSHAWRYDLATLVGVLGEFDAQQPGNQEVRCNDLTC